MVAGDLRRYRLDPTQEVNQDIRYRRQSPPALPELAGDLAENLGVLGAERAGQGQNILPAPAALGLSF
jgi:hypothetical protein